MINIKKYFAIAFLAIGAHAVAAPATETAASSAPAAAPALAAAPVTAAAGHEATAAAKTAAKPAEAALTQPSDWSMLLVGAGVLLLPRKRRVDNLVR